MITILPTKTPAELRLILIDEQLQLVENYAKGAAHALNTTMDLFWETPDELLLQICNAKGPVEMTQIFESHYARATAINELLADRGITPIAVIGKRKPLEFNPETGLFFFDYPVVAAAVEDT